MCRAPRNGLENGEQSKRQTLFLPGNETCYMCEFSCQWYLWQLNTHLKVLVLQMPEPSSLTRIVAPCLIEGKIMNSGLSKEAMSKLSSQLISS